MEPEKSHSPGTGMWSSPAEVKKIWKAEREFKVQMKVPDRRRRLASWDTALQRTLLWLRPPHFRQTVIPHR